MFFCFALFYGNTRTSQRSYIPKFFISNMESTVHEGFLTESKKYKQESEKMKSKNLQYQQHLLQQAQECQHKTQYQDITLPTIVWHSPPPQTHRETCLPDHSSPYCSLARALIHHNPVLCRTYINFNHHFYFSVQAWKIQYAPQQCSHERQVGEVFRG